MNRRSFLASSVTASALAGGSGLIPRASASATPGPSPEYIELRLYHLRRGQQHTQFDEYLRTAWVPAMNRIGISPIGVFEVMVGPENPTMYAVIPYKSLDVMAGSWARLTADPEFQKNGAAVLNAPPSEPAIVRMENSLMVAFDGMPRLQAPNFGEKQKSRIFELRTYESHSKKANRKKIEMFNTAEMVIFQRTGLVSVFFGDTLIGQKMPQLTYMLAFDSMESHDKNWAAFAADPDWKRLSTAPGNTDGEIVSSISNVFLRPTSYSQI
jgi:hypothetical protein